MGLGVKWAYLRSDLFSAQLQLLSVHQPRGQVDV